MSNYEYENGTFTLPTAAVAGLKKALRENQNAVRDQVFARARRAHAYVGATTTASYEKKLRQLYDVDLGPGATSVLWAMLRRREGKPPGVPTQADLFIPKATMSTTSFPILDDGDHLVGTITFDGRHVTWHVEEGNRSVDHAHDGSTAKVFFDYVDHLKWTRGTGGYTMYDSEYNEDEMGNRRGAQLGRTWGPLGAKRAGRRY